MAEHSPSPTPERAIYGFFLYITTYLVFGLYIMWAFLPDSILNYIGITYLPQRFWVFAGPLYCCMTLVFVICFYIAWNFFKTPQLNSISTITDQFSRKVPYNKEMNLEYIQADQVPRLGDLDIRTVNKHLYSRIPN
ncbi:phosphatidylinositol N-acetylglucosaminyltransferase subunit P-like isoform X1 [Xenia sp. Carnegie-2017]|uniref:phosphatidylinositol N-acetylglucosaminyltransferase subunit P-like isoform X1 n=1 Tax=Xenia sp. Carnegie-2017 TaxID=2897299 RepID=UPI001F03E3B4|nr:phosphatidylinositol N-acetylglucosaminyltransferase subunit P-like isoform X1 [Xenia sp. Carnegie-2017]